MKYRRKFWGGDVGLTPYVTALREAIDGDEVTNETDFQAVRSPSPYRTYLVKTTLKPTGWQTRPCEKECDSHEQLGCPDYWTAGKSRACLANASRASVGTVHKDSFAQIPMGIS